MTGCLSVSSLGSLLVHLPRQLVVTSTEVLRSRSVSELGCHPLQLKRASSPRRIVIRAARMESTRVTLGFRAPEFQKGLAVIAISSNSAVTHPEDGPEFMAEDAKLFNYPFPYLYDESQEVARDFGAVCTPEFYLFKKDGRRPFELVYHGQFDDSRPNSNVPVTGRDLSLAIDRVLSGQPVPADQRPSMGCSIKWHPGKKL